MYLPRRFYLALAVVVIALVVAFFWPTLLPLACGLAALLGMLLLADFALLWHRRAVEAWRVCPSRFSNGDDNVVRLHIESHTRVPLSLNVVDEIPVVFQRRDVNFAFSLGPRGEKTIQYVLHPVKRGEYGFGRIRVFARSPLGLIERRFTCGDPLNVKVYPSYLMLDHYELLAMGNDLQDYGIKRIRRVGNNTEFEQIKDYVQGDDYRTINWKATARRSQLMVNVYRDERSQPIFNVIDCGRTMQQAFGGMTLLDYAINASLILSHVALKKDDRAGLLTFTARLQTFVQASRGVGHMQNIMEALYKVDTQFGESDYSNLCVQVNKLVGKRSLLILYTNFIGLNNFNRQLPYLCQLNRRHRLLVVFFEDVELTRFAQTQARTVEDYYIHVIAEKFEAEKRIIVSTLRQNGILSLLTQPQQLTVDVINKYIEIKNRQLI